MGRRGTRALILTALVLSAPALVSRATRADPLSNVPVPVPALSAPSLNVPVPVPVPVPAPAHPPVPTPNFHYVDATWDREIRVLPAGTPGPRVLVYLHGYCGDINAVGAFVPAAAAHGTLIALLGDLPCKDKPGRFKWSRDIRGLQARIERAVRLVNHNQGLELDAHDITLFGYSQGAVRAESLARYYASHYPRVILGGPPRRPNAEHFKNTRAVAVFGGEKEETRDMIGGADDLVAAGLRARFFLLPGVDHGDFGDVLAGNAALTQILSFVSGDAPVQPGESAEVAR